MARTRRFFLLTCTIFILKSCVINPVTKKKDFMLMTERQEKQLGRSSDPEIIAYFGIYDDPELQKFITEKGEKMASISHRPDLGYQFRIVDSPVVNAFAVPGGYIYFTRGIMAHFNSTAEFAGVLGHEIGHITARHSAKQYSRSLAAQIGLVAGSLVSEEFARYAGLTEQGIGLLFLKFGRDAERQSDKLGVQYSTTIGYDAYQMAKFFNTLDQLNVSEEQSVPGFLSTHPNPGERMRKVKQLTEKVQKPDFSYKIQRDSYLELIDGIVYGENPRHGFFENGYFYHPEFRFYFPYPADWNTDNTSSQVNFAAKNGEAILQLTFSTEDNIYLAIDSFIKKNNLKSTEQALIRDDENIKVYSAHFRQVNNESTLEGNAYAIELGSSIFLLIGVCSGSDYQVYNKKFQDSAMNFQFLKDKEKLNRQPKRIGIRTISNEGPLEQQLKSFKVDAVNYSEHSRLNGMTLTDQLRKGDKIKIIVDE